MWHILFSMIATGSLAAFSAAQFPGLMPVRGTAPSERARRSAASASARLGAGTSHSPRDLTGVRIDLAAGEVLPRGSVLDVLV
jgi:hypothetical protein